jgi:hypothetical protein
VDMCTCFISFFSPRISLKSKLPPVSSRVAFYRSAELVIPRESSIQSHL